jgi:hypothetical protein
MPVVGTRPLEDMIMNSSTTIDRQDVAHSTNPIGGATQIEQHDLGVPPAATGESAGEKSDVCIVKTDLEDERGPRSGTEDQA